MPCRDSGLPHDTRNIMVTSGHVFERLRAREGQTSTIFDNSKNLASSSQPDTTETTRRRESDMKRESLNASIPSPHFQSRSGMLNHTGGTYSHNGIIDCPRFPISELRLGTFLDSLEFQRWKVNFKTEVCSKTADPHLTMHRIKEVEIAKSIDELMTSRSIVERSDFPDYDMLDAMIAFALKKTYRHADTLLKESNCRKAAYSNIRPILTRETNCLHDLRAFPCNRSLSSGRRTLRLIHYMFAERRCRRDPWKDCTSQNYRTLSSFRLCWLCMTMKLFEIIGRQVTYV